MPLYKDRGIIRLKEHIVQLVWVEHLLMDVKHTMNAQNLNACAQHVHERVVLSRSG